MLICNFYGQCEISMKNRHACPACRLAKCFKWGMTTDKFRPSRQIKPKTIISLRLQARCQPERLPTLTLLQSDKSILTNDEWVFFTNLFNYFKECPVFSIAQQLIRMPDGFQSSYRMYTSCVEQFLVCIYNTAGAYLHSNDDLRNLSFDN
ncbi:unnamed protein product [Rotaria socialis]|uniref:Nuclear receptor domain-containing protein n=1 Tax=Rotaria socialis TaxID=392032 RepID=A0A817VWS5_9BILA|nr:unnamed protein product [Rotaria socialis]CAF3769026.1 unnamed protein product [Rotaria socialis]